MFKKHHAAILLVTVAQLFCLSLVLADEANWLRIVPKEANEILANPGIGWETFITVDKWLPGEVELFTEVFFRELSYEQIGR